MSNLLVANLPPGFSVITQDEAEARFQTKKLDGIGRTFHAPILLHAGDLHVKGDLDEDWLQSSFYGDERERRQDFLIIDGNLRVDGSLALGDGRTFPSLYVRGNLHCTILELYSSLTQVDGDIEVDRAYLGFGSAGQLRYGGTAKAPLFIARNHPDWIPVTESMVAINFSSDEDEYVKFDYELHEAIEIFDPALFVDGTDMDDEAAAYNFKEAALQRLRAGVTPFRAGVVPRKKGGQGK